jgi:hypothetical protein
MKIQLKHGVMGYSMIVTRPNMADQWLGFQTYTEMEAFLFGIRFAGGKFEVTSNEIPNLEDLFIGSFEA